MTRIEFQHGVEDILKVPHGTLKETDSRETVESWSSFSDVDIVEFIERKLGMQADADLMEAETFGDILRNLEGKGLLTA